MKTEHQLKDLGQILKYAEQYKDNQIYHKHYKKSKDKDRDRYFRQHEAELILYDDAVHMLKSFGITPQNYDIEKLRNDFNALYSKKQTLQATYKSAEKEISDLNRKLTNLNQYLDRTPEPQHDERKNKEIQIPSKSNIIKGALYRSSHFFTMHPLTVFVKSVPPLTRQNGLLQLFLPNPLIFFVKLIITDL